MRVRASYKLINRDPDKKGFDNTDFYTKTVTVPDNYDLNFLRKQAKWDTKDGFKFIQIDILDRYIEPKKSPFYILLSPDDINEK